MSENPINVSTIAQILRKIAGGGEEPIALHEPRFAEQEWDLVRDCLESGWVSSVGKYVDQFERNLAEKCGMNHCVAVVNGTAALQVSLMVAGVKHGDEILIPALTFVATANAVSHCGAIPHLVDSALDTHLDVIAQRLPDGTIQNKQTNRPITAIVPMHTFGHPVDMKALDLVAQKWALPIISDATEALGSQYHGKPVTAYGDLSILSFNGNKIITCGGGGAILTNDATLAKKAKHLTTTAKVPHRWDFDHDEIAFNYRLPNINAALGCAQLEKLDEILLNKRNLATQYQSAFAQMNGVTFITEPEDCQSNYWLNALLFEEGHEETRDDLLALTNDAGLMTRPPWKLMNHLSIYKEAPSAPLPVALKIEKLLINIPSSAFLGQSSA